jgi:hypothetical protein
MYLENVVVDAVDPQRLGRFWEAVLGSERLTDETEGFETRLAVDGGPMLDLCFPRVPERPTAVPRLRLDLSGRDGQAEEVERLIGLGARLLDVGHGVAPSVLLADPEGNPFSVLPDRAADADTDADADTGPVAVLCLDSAEPDRDASFWSWLTGWTPAGVVAPRWQRHPALRHPSLRGPFLELRPETEAKGATKNPMHLDVRLEAGDDPDAIAVGITERGGRELHPEWGVLPWRVYTDPSGNELCVLPARS